MSQPLNYLDEVKKQTGELLKQIEAYKSSRELNESSSRALDALCQALDSTVRNLKPFSDDVFEKIAKSTAELQLVISGQEEKFTSLHTVVEEFRGSNLDALQNIEENMKESQEISRISIGKALTDLESVTKSGQDSLQGALITEIKKSTKAIETAATKLNKATEEATADLKAHVDGACRLILDGHETVNKAIAEQEEKNSGRAKFQGVLLLIIAGILIYRLYLEVLSS